MTTACRTLKNCSSNVNILDEGVLKVTGVANINFTGGGVTVTGSGSNVVVAIPGAPKPTSWVWNASKDGGAVMGFSDGTLLTIPAMPVTPCIV